MKECSVTLLSGVLVVLWIVPVPHAPAQGPTEEELKDFERQAEQLEKKQAEAKRKAEAATKATAAAEASRKAAQKQAEEEERRAGEEARVTRPDGRKRAPETVSALAGELVDIPGGSFQIGCSPDDSECQYDEQPVHTVSIKRFSMGKYEVTVGQFRRFVEATGYRTDAEERGSRRSAVLADRSGADQPDRDWKNPGFPQTERHPVVYVNWNDAKAYVHWLSRQGGGRYRLPSESEWEYAARAGSSARYSFGESEGMLCDYGNVADRTAQQQFDYWLVPPCDDGALYTAPVGEYQPNSFGRHDMHGNVWEWTDDCHHDSYTGAPSDGAAWTAGECARRVLRGGSWYYMPQSLRSADRYWYSPERTYEFLGFRLAKTL